MVVQHHSETWENYFGCLWKFSNSPNKRLKSICYGIELFLYLFIIWNVLYCENVPPWILTLELYIFTQCQKSSLCNQINFATCIATFKCKTITLLYSLIFIMKEVSFVVALSSCIKYQREERSWIVHTHTDNWLVLYAPCKCKESGPNTSLSPTRVSTLFSRTFAPGWSRWAWRTSKCCSPRRTPSSVNWKKTLTLRPRK